MLEKTTIIANGESTKFAGVKEITNQDKIQYLKKYRNIDANVTSLLEEKELWFSRATKVTQTITDMPRGGDGEDSRQKAICRMIEVDDEANQEIDKLVDMGKEIKGLISSLPDEELRLLLKLRYIDGMKFEKIAVQMNYSWRNIHYMHSKALKNLCVVLHKE